MMVLFFTQACSAMKSDYDNLMNPIKKIKLAEKKAGKPNPVFDGVVEPDFPDETENNKTLEGVDANHDGVRDDVEIWINRTAEDEYVRWAMKDYYKKQIIMYRALYNNESEPVIHRAEADSSDSASCLGIMHIPYDKEFIAKYHREPKEMNSHKLYYLFPNNKMRKIAESKLNTYQISGALGGDFNYCEKSKVGSRAIDIIKKFQEHQK